MKARKELLDLLGGSSKNIEKALDMKIKNGQALKAVKKTLIFVLDDDK